MFIGNSAWNGYGRVGSKRLANSLRLAVREHKLAMRPEGMLNIEQGISNDEGFSSAI
jgi:hypothetical protein